MASANATALGDYLEAYEPENTLKELTCYGGSGTAVDRTILDEKCEEAIDAFTVKVAAYDPANYEWHKRAAKNYAMYLLFLRATRWDEAKSMLATFEIFAEKTTTPQEKRRTPAPYTDGDEDEVVFNDENLHWDGYTAD